jgi:hypothetical protein
MLSVSTGLLLPMIETYGHLFTNAVVALLSLASFGYVFFDPTVEIYRLEISLD